MGERGGAVCDSEISVVYGRHCEHIPDEITGVEHKAKNRAGHHSYALVHIDFFFRLCYFHSVYYIYLHFFFR